MSDHVIHATDADFDSHVLQSSEPVLVDFWAQWCGPCKMIAPALDELADTYAGRAKVVQLAKAMGLRPPLPDTPSLPIGAEPFAQVTLALMRLMGIR